MTWPKRKQAQDQRRRRRQKHERAFLFTMEGHLLGAVERVPWEVALADSGGNVADAAMACGLADATPARLRNARARLGVAHGLHNAGGSRSRGVPASGYRRSLRGDGRHRRGERPAPGAAAGWR